MARTDPRPHYGIGRRTRTDGYVDVWAPDHPLARRDGYVSEHRRMAWDAGMLTDPSLQVHHKNEQRADNRLDNFEIKDVVRHALEHAEERGWIRNQYGCWEVKPAELRVSAPRPEGRSCPSCFGPIDPKTRRDAIYCSANCRIREWKRKRKERS